MLTWKEKYLRTVKKHQKRATTHSLIALALLLGGIIVFSHSSPKYVNASRDQHSILNVSMVGDMMFGRNIPHIANRHRFSHFFRYVQPYFDQSDLITGNFENPIVQGENYKQADKFIHLKAEKSVAAYLKKTGFTTVNLANNHMMDFGPKGLTDTVNTFQIQGIDTVGAGMNKELASKISYYKINGLNVATVGFTDAFPKDFIVDKKNPGVLSANPNNFFPLIREAKKKADLVIVHVHWGNEYDSDFHPRQRDIARAMVDAGADIIIGHHPHVLEAIDTYKGAVIFYSMGNFVFDQGWSRTKESILAQYRLYSNGRAKIEVIPLWIHEGQPQPLTGKWDGYRRARIFRELTKKNLVKWKIKNNKLVIELDHSKKLR